MVSIETRVTDGFLPRIVESNRGEGDIFFYDKVCRAARIMHDRIFLFWKAYGEACILRQMLQTI